MSYQQKNHLDLIATMVFAMINFGCMKGMINHLELLHFWENMLLYMQNINNLITIIILSVKKRVHLNKQFLDLNII